jgi:hypothetical protein
MKLANLLAREQEHLKWLFSLPDKFRFNFSPVAGFFKILTQHSAFGTRCAKVRNVPPGLF